MKKNKTMIVVFLAPAVIMFCIIFLYPIIRTVAMSFFKIEGVTDAVSKWQFSGLANYIKLFNTQLFRISMWNIFRIWLIGGIIVMGLALLFATILTSGIRFKSTFRAIIYMPNVVSAVALATMWLQYVFSPKFGLFKSIGELLHWEWLAKFQWLDPSHMFIALLVAYCFGMVGYHMLIFASGIERIGIDYFEAATLDGANKIQQFRYITLVGQNGYMKNSFFGLLILSISPQKKQLEEQLYLEIKAQMMAAMKFMRKDQAVGVDSHQHTHMIPLVFRVLLRVIEECRIPVQYLRIPAEPIMPFLMEPSMYLSYKPVNLIKNVVLNFLWLFNRKLFQESGITSALFCGIIFSGNMDAKRVMKVFPHFYRLAEKRGYDLEFLFHPGYIKSGEEFMDPFKTAFHKFYLSSGRKLEYAALHNPKWCEMITKNNDHSGRED